MRSPDALVSWLYLPFHGRRTYWYCISQLILRHCTSRHVLRSCPLPLRSINGGRLCHYGRFRTLIPPIYRLHTPQHMDQSSLRNYVRRGKFNILPSTLPRTCWYASSIFGLPRRLHLLKLSILTGLLSLTYCSDHVPIYYLGSICCQARSTLSSTHIYKYGVTTRVPTPPPHI